jgi:hypothetical protein
VPIGTLLRTGDEWVLDVWIARRDLVATPPRDAWEWRLGLRPWAVFVAQVLQFQAQLAGVPGIVAMGEAVFGDAEQFYEAVLKAPPRSRRAVQQVWQEWQRQHRQPTAEGTLPGYGFGELPPAGFLLAPAGEGPLQPQVEAIFGPNVVVRLRHNSADAALRAVTGAQHLDRIPLDQPENKPVVDVWIPDVAADLPAVRTESYGWIAFVRSRDEAAAAAPTATDQVKVYAVSADLQHETTLGQVVDRLAGANWAGGQLVATLEYPAAEWGVPTPEGQLAAVRDKVTNMLRDQGQGLWGVIGLASTDSRCPLAAARAALLPVGSRTDEPLQLLPTYAAKHEGGEEAVLLVFGIVLT